MLRTDKTTVMPEKDIFRMKLPDNKLLVLRKGSEWRDAYLERLILPMLYGDIPAGAELAASSQNAKCWRIDTEYGALFIKFFKPRGLRDTLSFIKTRSLRAVEGGAILLQNGFLTPLFVAQGEVLKGFKVLDNFIITRWIEGSLNTYHFLKSFFDPPLDLEILQKKRIFIKALGRLIGSLHGKGVSHGDLGPGNILIKFFDDHFHFYFIDNERTKYFSPGIPFRLREKNLIQINTMVKPQLTITDRLRFFKSYLSENTELIPDAKALALKIASKTGKRLLKKSPDILKRNKLPKQT